MRLRLEDSGVKGDYNGDGVYDGRDIKIRDQIIKREKEQQRQKQIDLSLERFKKKLGFGIQKPTATFYNPKTGHAVIVEQPELSGYFKERKKRRAIRRRERTKRIENRQIAKTEKQGLRQKRKTIRIQGTIDKTQARQAAAVAKYAPEVYPEDSMIDGTMSPTFEPQQSDYTPSQPYYGAMVSPEMYGTDNVIEGDIVDAEYLPDEYQDSEYYEDEPTGELSAGPLLPMIAGLLPQLLPAVSNLFPKAAATKTGQFVNAATGEVIQLKKQNSALMVKLDETSRRLEGMKYQRYVFAGVGLLTGVGIGYAISRRR